MKRYLDAWRAMPGRQVVILVALAGWVALANVDQPFPDLAPLQHIPTVVVLIGAPLLLGRFPLSDRSVMALAAFFALHTLAGRYTYSYVPYDQWARALTGHDISGALGLGRNDFDRVVHVSFGLLWVGPVAELARRHAGAGSITAIVIGFLFVGAASAAYEIFEWLLTIVVAPEMAADYNGQQGDPWDSQKDMTVATLGAIISSLRQFQRTRRRR